MSEDELRKIGEFLEMHAFAHRTVEHCDYWTYEEKMILDLYNNYLNLLGQQKEFTEWLEEEINRLDDYCHDYHSVLYSMTLYELQKTNEILSKFKEIVKEVE